MEAKPTARIRLDYPFKVRELRYQLKVGIWKAGRGPHPDATPKETR